RHRVQLEWLAQAFDVFCGGDRHQPQFFRSALPVTIAVKNHSLALFLHYSVSEILQSGQGLCVSCKQDRCILTSECNYLTFCSGSYGESQLERRRLYKRG